MKPHKTIEVEAALKKKGFELKRKTDHKFYELMVNGKKTGIRTKISHGRDEIQPSILAKMAIQVKLSNGDFERLIECPLSRSDYLNDLGKQNII